MVSAEEDVIRRKANGLGRSQSVNEPIFFKMRNYLLPWVGEEHMKNNRPLPAHLVSSWKQDELARMRFIAVCTVIVTGVCLLGRTRYMKSRFENTPGAYPSWYKQK